MATLTQARSAVAEQGRYLSHAGDSHEGWAVVSREYSHFKYSRVYFTVVAADPDGDLWSYTVCESTNDGTEVVDSPIPVSAVTQTKNVVTFTPRLIPRTQETP
ncbi:hypothetical protein ABFV47_32805 [Mycolicibacterium fortuitum]|uniref:hypothetical protein n=1 Tax=Mycolicibacterium TaxID=1866885 RepID=UPI003204649E